MTLINIILVSLNFLKLHILLIFTFNILIFVILPIIRKNFFSINVNKRNYPPGPTPLPIIGNLLHLSGYDVPYKAFDKLAGNYGPIISLRLGFSNVVIVNGIENIKEVLTTKAFHFDGRPNFQRYSTLFGGNKENSLAFCNWSSVQKMRREMLVPHTFPKTFSSTYANLNEIVRGQMVSMLCDLTNNFYEICENNQSVNLKLKPFLTKFCANVFMEHFCSKTFSNTNIDYQKAIENFDKVFNEISQGYAADFLPFLSIFHWRKQCEINKSTHQIRKFIEENIIRERLTINDVEEDTGRHHEEEEEEEIVEKNDYSDGKSVKNKKFDYVDALLKHVKLNLTPKLEMDTALYAIEDIIGGHSAVVNFVNKLFYFVAQHPLVQEKIQKEIFELAERKYQFDENECKDKFIVNLMDRSEMPYTEAVIMETLRLVASPIVPHAANQNSTIGDYFIDKDTLIILNNYALNMSSELWDEPDRFDPERFLKGNCIVKPDFFLPFGTGRRSCMGYKMVQLLSFTILTNIMNNFNLQLINEKLNIQIGSLTLSHPPEFRILLRV